MNKRLLFLFLFSTLATFMFAQNVWMNEIHYDNDGTDQFEGLEIAGTAGTDISNWQIVPYNGNGGIIYSVQTIPATTLIPNDGSGYGAIWFDIAGLQNGAPDGVALVNSTGTVLQFLSYEGSISATNGPASGMTSVDIGVEEPGTATIGTSMQLTGTGSTYSDFTWETGIVRTPDLVNTGQTFGSGADTESPVVTWSPSDAQTGVYINSTVVLSFDEPVRNIDDTEITDANVASLLVLKLTDDLGADVAFTATIGEDKQSITIIPDSELLNNQVYFVGLSAVEDANDNAMLPQSIYFTTIDASVVFIELTDPVGGEQFYAGNNPTINWNSANITSVDIKVYIPDSDEWLVLADDIANDGSETVSIPTDADYSTAYKIAVVDIADDANADTSGAFTIIATPDLNTIQSSTSDGDATVFINDIVLTSGVVSYKNGSTYYLQSGTGAWNGIMVYDGANSGSLHVGDSISLQAKVVEYQGVTELSNVSSLTVHSTGKTVILNEISTVSYDESYESVPVKFINSKVTNPLLGSGEFEINDGSGPLVVDDKYYLYSPTLNENITLSGIGYFSNSAYKVLPRTYQDILSASDTVTSAEYTVNNTTETITNILYSTTLAVFKSNVTACDSATYNVYDADGITPATVLDDTKLLVVVAADGITSKTYAITRNAVSTDAAVSSALYTVNDINETITTIPYGTDLATFESGISAPAGGSFETYQSDGLTVATDLQTGYILVGTAEDGTTTKSYTITVNAMPMDADSYVLAPTVQIEEDTAVVVETDGRDEAIPVFAFDITDAGTADGEPTNVSQIVIYLGPENTASINTDIDSGYFAIDGNPVEFNAEPVVGTDSVAFSFAQGQIVVPDGGSVHAVLFINLDSHASEDSIIQFMIPAEQHGFEAYPSGSSLTSPFAGDIIGNKITIDVVATAIQFAQQPTSVFVNDTIEPAVVVAAVDANGNTDSDYTSEISLTSNGASLLYTPHLATPVNGIAVFDTLIFSSTGSEVTLNANSDTLDAVTSVAFVVAEVSDLDLYFSEYIEGSSYNKAIEIYNPTGLTVDLNNYILKGTSDVAADWEYIYSFPENAMIQPDEVYVIVHSSANAEMLKTGDWITSGYVLGFNGNDARGLFKITDGDTVLIDILGSQINSNESDYQVAGVEGATKDHTLVRKPTINTGNTDWAASAGTNADDSEWIVYDKDYFDDLGKRSFGGNVETDILTFTIPGYTVDTATKIFAENDSIAITVVYTAQLDSLFPVFTLSAGATSVPASGDSVDFSSGQADFVVTAEDNTIEQNWTVYIVDQLTEIQTGNDFISFSISNQVNTASIDYDENTISALVKYGTDVSKLVPAFILSSGAKSNLVSGDTTDFSDTVEVLVTAENGDQKMWKISVTPEVPVEGLTIYDIQYTQDTTGDSPYRNKLVRISGFVTAVEKDGFFLQDAESEWSGIYVYKASAKINDSVMLVGVVTEFNGLTELTYIAEIKTFSKTSAQFNPIPVTTSQASEEAYECLLVKVDTAECTNEDASFGMFKVNDGSGDILVDDVIYSYTPTKGNYYTISGVMYYSYSESKILPRTADDIIDLGTLEKSNDASLSDLKVDGTTVTGFSGAFLSYEVELSAGTTTTPTVTYTTRDDNATAIVENAVDVTSVNPDDRISKVIVTAENGTTTRTYSILFTVKTTGLQDVDLSHVTVYPNPVHTQLTVNNINEVNTISILNMIGKQIASVDTENENSVEFDVSSLSSGVYILQLKAGNAIKNLKFIKE